MRRLLPLMIFDVECPHCGEIHAAKTYAEIEKIMRGQRCAAVADHPAGHTEEVGA